ncbi:prepilin peptidase [bacterium]|nr:prepilin peptidase [bacterium]
MLIAALLGLGVGSFLNVCIHRVPQNISVVMPRSRCPACGHVLSPGELIPVLSFLCLLGKCKSCKVRISARYPIVEILTAGVFLFCHAFFWRAGDPSSAAAYAVFYSALIVITFIDIDHFLIFDVMTYPGMLIFLAWSLAGHHPLHGGMLERLIASFLGLLAGAGVLWVIQFFGALWYRQQGLSAMGLGDVKLAAFTGAFLGPRYELAALLLGVFIGGTIAVALMLAGRKGRKDYMPFGPALAIGAAIAPFAGDWLLAIYNF